MVLFPPNGRHMIAQAIAFFSLRASNDDDQEVLFF